MIVKKRIWIRDLKPGSLKIEYGSSGSHYPACIDVMTEIPKRFNLGTFSVNDLAIEPVHHIPLDSYLYSDFSDKHRPSYPVAGSLGCRIIRPDGKEASLYLVNFFHYEDNHHNPWIWGRDFDGSKIWDKNISFHDEIPLDEPLQVKLTIGEDIIDDEFDSTT